MQRVKNAHFQIGFQSADVLHVHDGYPEIDLKDDWFIWQYGQALQGKLIPSSMF